MRKVLSIVLSLVMVLSICSLSAFAGSYTVDEETGNAAYDNAYGFEFRIDDINGTISGEDSSVYTTQDAYDGANAKWAVSVLLTKTGENTYVAASDGTPGGGSNPAFTLGEDQVVLVVHSSSSRPTEAETYPNWEQKVALLAVKAGDIFTFSGCDFAAGTVDAEGGKAVVSAPVIPETITIDGVLDDNGWASDGWTSVDETNGVIQEAPGDTPLSPVAYKYQLRTDDEYLYFGAELNCDAAEGGNGVGTNVRFWIKSNDEATVYTHFYDVFLKDGAVATNSKYNTSATENKGAAIENPSIVAEMKTSDGKTYVEFKVLLSEFTTGNFEYFIAVSNVKDGVNTCLFYPAIAISDEEGQRLANFPYRLWYTEGAAECDIEAVKLGTTSPVQRPTDDKLVNVVLGKKYTWTEGAVRTGGYGDHNEDGTCKYRLTDGAWSVTGFDELVAGYQNGYNEITFNLGEEREIWGIKTDLTSGGWGIDVNGGLIELKISDDGENWTSVASKEINTEELTFAIDNEDGSGVYVFNLEAKGQSAKYVKVCYSTSGHIWASEIEVYALKVADKPDTSLMGVEPDAEGTAFTVEITGPESWTEIGEELTFNVKITATGETSKGFSMFSFNIYFNDELALIDDYDLAASITKCPNDSEWKGDDTFYAVEHDEETGYSYVKCAIMTSKETTLQKDDTIEFTITFKTTSAASEYVSLQIPHGETVGVDYDMNQYLGIGDSAAVLEYVEQEESGDDSSSGELGDSGIYAIAVVALVAMIGTAVVIKKRARA